MSKTDLYIFRFSVTHNVFFPVRAVKGEEGGGDNRLPDSIYNPNWPNENFKEFTEFSKAEKHYITL